MGIGEPFGSPIPTMFTWMPFSAAALAAPDSVVLMVLAVGDQDDRLIGRLVRGKGTGGQVDGGTDRRTLRRDHRRVDRGQEHLGGDIIRGDRQLRESVAGEHDQTYLIIRKAVRQSG